MNKKAFVGLIVVLAIAGGVYFLLRSDKKTDLGLTPETVPESVKQANQSASQNSVIIKDMAFSPSFISVKKGTKITWTNQDSTTHTVSSKSDSPESFDSGNLDKNGSFSFTFNTVGTYNYFCNIHPNMIAAVNVTDQ